MNALTFIIELLQPVLATQPHSGEANSAVSYPFIPGSMIRGAVISGYMQRNGLTRLDMDDDPRVIGYFFNGKVKYLNAYLAHPRNGLRALPKPKSWFVPKDDVSNDRATIYDFALKPKQWKQAPKSPKTGDFCWLTDEEVVLQTPELQVTVHNASEEPTRKSAGVSQVYRYDALSAGQQFAGAIITDDIDFLENTLQSLLTDARLNIGGSFTGGYGSVRITQVELVEDWKEYSISTSDADSNLNFEEQDDDDIDLLATRLEAGDSEHNQVTLTCLSDVILRDPVEGQVGNCLAKILGCEPDRSFYQTRLVGSFNRHWGMPTPQEISIMAGSVFVFPSQYQEKLEKIAETGIGERQAEGFGRVAVGLQYQPEYKQLPYTKPATELKLPETLSEISIKLAQRMATRQFEIELDIALTARINELTAKMEHLPSATQLSRTRLATRSAWHKNNLDPLKEHMAHLSELTLRNWQDASLGNKPLLDWLKNQIENPEQNAGLVSLPVVAGERVHFADVAPQVTARLIEGVLRRAVKQAKIEVEGGSRG